MVCAAGARQPNVTDECQQHQQHLDLNNVLRGNTSPHETGAQRHKAACAPQQIASPVRAPLHAPAQKQGLVPVTRSPGASHTPADAPHVQPPSKQQSSSTSTAKLLQLMQQSRKLLLNGQSAGRGGVCQSPAVHTQDHLSSDGPGICHKNGHSEASVVRAKCGKRAGVSAEHQPLQRGSHGGGGHRPPEHALHSSAEQ